MTDMTGADLPDVLVVGAGIGGLTLALELHAAGRRVEVVEVVEEIGAVGVGINVLPHASRVLAELGLLPDLEAAGIATSDGYYFNRFGQLIHRERLGRSAGHSYPQLSLHRGDLHGILHRAVLDRLGPSAVRTGVHCTGFEQDDDVVTLHAVTTAGGSPLPPIRGRAAVGCDGIRSTLRRQLHPDEGAPRYSGVNMWRGTSVAPPILGGSAMVRAGWLTTGKVVIYPIRDLVNAGGAQLVNWVAELETAQHKTRAWNTEGSLADFAAAFADWSFPWLDVPDLLARAESVLEYPMVDQDPLPSWGVGRVTLLGDAAHPMVPRGSNGAGQAILDARSLRVHLESTPDVVAALAGYEAERRPATSAVVLANRQTPPDAILREVYERTGDRAFDDISEVISAEEMEDLLGRYRQLTSGSDV
jgi:2-polyprenyl-6-methoxyphenol hydroxylase-like FAD-dependent oxidoreductase